MGYDWYNQGLLGGLFSQNNNNILLQRLQQSAIAQSFAAKGVYSPFVGGSIEETLYHLRNLPEGHNRSYAIFSEGVRRYIETFKKGCWRREGNEEYWNRKLNDIFM